MIAEKLSKTVVERIKAADRTWSSGTTLFRLWRARIG
jgi:hypothetical protein